MSISARSEYACRAIIELARNHPRQEIKQLKDIASAQAIPDKYLVHILLQLKQHGIIGSVRGASGGYYLRKSPAKISLGEVMRIVDGPLLPTKALSAQNTQNAQGQPADFSIIWQDVNKALSSVLDNISFSHVLEKMQIHSKDLYQI